MNYKVKPYSMICGQSEAQRRRYHLHKGKSGRVWLVAVQPNQADNIYVEGGPDSDGFGGTTLSFTLEDGHIVQLKGPWHTNSVALFEDTGVDIRDRHLTFGVIGEGREYDDEGTCIITDVIFKDIEPTVGIFNRVTDYAQILANSLNKTLYCYRESTGGSSCGPVYPNKNK